MINVTKSFLPEFAEYESYLKRIWASGHLTNNGPLVLELENKLKEFLGVKHLIFTSNGTVVLQMALKAYDITKEVITTPFSYVATTNAIVWEGCKPVFVDIHPSDFCIDADKIEEKITENTQAILATHVYGYPCNIEKIQRVASQYKLKVIYDGAHAFACKYRGKSLLSFGDISTCSFHSTKLFHTIEGGCIITADDAVANQLILYRQFGHVGEDHISVGINGKNSEFHAAMGLCNLPRLPEIIANRKKVCNRYDEALKKLNLQRPVAAEGLEYNSAYYPVVFNTEADLLTVKGRLSEQRIFARRYFFPSLNELKYVDYQSMPVSEDISRRVLSLPLSDSLAMEDVDRICSIITEALG